MTDTVIVAGGAEKDVAIDAESWRRLDLVVSLCRRDGGLPFPDPEPVHVPGAEALRIAEDLQAVLWVVMERRIEDGQYDWPPGAFGLAALWSVFVRHGTDGVRVARVPEVD